MGSLGQGILGAGAGFAAGGPGTAILGGIQGLFGHAPKEDPVAQQQRQFQQNIASRLYEFSQGAPGSDPGELAALASSRGALGADQRQYQQGAFSQYNPQMRTSLADMATNLASRFAGQQMALQESQLTASLQARRQALLEAAQVAPKQGAQYQPNNLSAMLGQLAQQMAYQQGRKKGGSGAAPDSSQDVPYQGSTIPMQGPPDPNSGAIPGPQGGNLTIPGQLGGNPAQSTPFFPQLSLPGSMQGVGMGAPATTQGMPPMPGPSLGDQTYAAQQGALPNAGNVPGGLNSTNNQARQSSGLQLPQPFWQTLHNPYGLSFGG